MDEGWSGFVPSTHGEHKHHVAGVAALEDLGRQQVLLYFPHPLLPPSSCLKKKKKLRKKERKKERLVHKRRKSFCRRKLRALAPIIHADRQAYLDLWIGLPKQESLQLSFELRQSEEIPQTGGKRIPDRRSDGT